MPQRSHSANALVSPDCIASGIGLADRRELCGLLAVLDATKVLQLAQGAVSAVQEKLGLDATQVNQRLARVAGELFDGPIPTDALRHRLWLEIGQALGAESLLPLSIRKTRETACAIGILVAERLEAGILAEEEEAPVDPSLGGRIVHKLKRLTTRATAGKAARVIRFPDIVAAELNALLKGMAAPATGAEMDPAIVEAIRSGQGAMAAAVASGGGWAAFATAMGSAGFAPYLFAAQLSAFVPFVSGPALVSFLAVIINPVTVVAGAALGAWAIGAQANTVRATVASRLAVLMALRGMANPEEGIAALVSAFRSLPRLRTEELPHLSARQAERIGVKLKLMEGRLCRSLPPALSAAPGEWGQPLDIKQQVSNSDAAAVTTLTAGDMLFHAAAIDTAVLRAADFSRSLDLVGPLDLAAHVSAFVSEGAKTSLRGYTAEQLVLVRLVDEGHSAELAANSTMPGFDLIVDGYEVQVKCGTSLSLLEEHFDKYPDIPVIADAGLAEMAKAAGTSWSHMVTTVDGFDLEAVEQLVAQTLEAADALAVPDVPFFAMIVGMGRGVYRASAGEIPVGDLPAWVLIDLSIRGGLATTGKVGGGLIGLLAIGPAGAIVLSPVLGIAALLGTGKVHGMVDRAIHADWHKTVIGAAANLRRTLLRSLERQAECLNQRRSAITSSATTLRPDLAAWLDARALDDAVAAIEAVDELPPADGVKTAMELLLHAARRTVFDPDVAAARAQLTNELSGKPSTVAAAQKIWESAANTFSVQYTKTR